MHLTKITAVLLSASVFSGCALLQPKQPEGPSPLELQVQALEQRLARLERQVQGVANSDLMGQIQGASERERSMRGQVEQMQYQIQQMTQRQRDLYADVDERLANVESSANSSTTSSSSTNSGNDALAYNAAIGLLRERQYGDAAAALQSFINGYPESNLIGTAYYWLGESHYINRDYQQAEAAYQAVVTQHADDKKAPDAQLKLGYIAAEQKQWAVAKGRLAVVISEHPGTSAANLAQEKLNSIQRAGN